MLDNCTQRLTFLRHAKNELIDQVIHHKDQIKELELEVRSILYKQAGVTHHQMIEKDGTRYKVCSAEVIDNVKYLSIEKESILTNVEPMIVPLHYFKGCI